MTETNQDAAAESAPKPSVARGASSSAIRPGLGMSAQLAMWVVVVTLCLIALPKGLVDALPWSAANKSQAQIKDQMRALEVRAEAAAAAANDAKASARATDACVAAMASGVKLAKSCAIGAAAPPQTPNSTTSIQSDPLRPIADIAKMTLDASKDKYDSIKDSNDKLFSVLAAMGALLAFLGFKGLDTFVTAKSAAEKATVDAQKAQDEADKAVAKLGVLFDLANKKSRSEVNVSHGITLLEIAEVYKHCWGLQNHGKNSLPPLPPTELAIYRAYLRRALYYLDAALLNRDDLDEILVLRALGMQCRVYRRLEDYEMALAIARQIIAAYPEKDDSAYYNAACYCSLIGERSAANQVSPATGYDALALKYLREAVVLEPDNKKEALEDADFNWLRAVKMAEFSELVK